MTITHSTSIANSLRKSNFIVLALLLFLICLTPYHSAFGGSRNSGKISGQIIDQETGEALPGAVIQIKLEDKTIGTQTDFDGNYLIREVPEGTFDLEIFLAGYAKTKVENVKVSHDETTKVNLSMAAEAYEDNDQVVVARPIENNEAILLIKRKNEATIANAISAEGMSNSGVGDAADAVARIAGGTERGGKSVNMRGLEDRYISTHINGIEMPSADPDKKTFHMDLIPSSLLDNIQVIKSFTPDMPGNFSGGIIDIGTKTYPEHFTMKFSASSGYNSQVSFNDKFLTYHGGSHDWLGMDDGSREIPSQISGSEIPQYSYTITDAARAHQLSNLSKAFNNIMTPSSKAAPLNGGYSFSIGNQTTLFGKQFGYLGSLNYSRDYSYYDNGQLAYYFVSGDPQTVQGLTNDWKMSDAKGVEQVLWGGLITASYHPHPNHKLGMNFIHSQSGESLSRYMDGHFYDGNLSPEATYETRVLKYTERTLNSYQFNGKHYLPAFLKSSVEWNASYSKNRQNEPDMRFFSDHYYIDAETGDTSYYISPNLYTLPQRFYRDLDEDSKEFDLKWSVPFKQWNSLPSRFSFGGLVSNKNRNFIETVYNFKNPANKYTYNGDPAEFFSQDNMGIVDSTFNPYSNTWKYTWSMYVYDNSDPRANYTGDENIGAFFGMLDMPLSHRLRFVGGARYETTDINVSPVDKNYESGVINTKDILPSVNLIYSLSDKINLRSAYGRTLARPTFREMAPYPSWDFANEFYFIGNPNLKRTLIDNYDFRLEYYGQPGELLAASFFLKDFKNPIERAIKHENGEIQYQNVDKAAVYGAEFELRKDLHFLGNMFKYFMLSSNVTLIKSKVDIPSDELAIIRSYDPGADATRPLQGQSPYIFNIDFMYNNSRTKTMANISYNIFGERLYEVSQGATPDVYEQPRPELNFIFNQRIFSGIDMKLSFKNILDSDSKYVQHFLGKDYVKMEHKYGRYFSLGLSYSL